MRKKAVPTKTSLVNRIVGAMLSWSRTQQASNARRTRTARCPRREAFHEDVSDSKGFSFLVNRPLVARDKHLLSIADVGSYEIMG